MVILTLPPILALTEALAATTTELADTSVLPEISAEMVPDLVTLAVMDPPGPSLYLVPFHHDAMW
ncbi:hypothetical protein VT52_029080 [Streptomyces malaysiense]|uniref:Secreted protein n=1 Tax=Streptomyces malaysiense TaxID=1428626 RepID=A0A1J4PW63_9ACTN|nr:hypothetical protein VT52_029080 [Streptomyces malaysiense]